MATQEIICSHNLSVESDSYNGFIHLYNNLQSRGTLFTKRLSSYKSYKPVPLALTLPNYYNKQTNKEQNYFQPFRQRCKVSFRVNGLFETFLFTILMLI